MARIQDVMRRLADELDEAESGEEKEKLAGRVEALESRNPGSFVEAFKSMSEEDRRTIADALGMSQREVIEEQPTPPPPPPPPPAEPPANEQTPPAARTRPGRKRGRLYHYRTDERGRVVETAVPTIYSGEDEPDEVELPAEDEPEGESAAA